MRFEQETSVYKDEEIQDRIDAAGGAATRYITEIGNGIRVHPETDTQNYLDIKDGLEIFRAGESVAKYGETTRIGNEEQAHILLDPAKATMSGIDGNEVLSYGSANDPDTALAEVTESGYAVSVYNPLEQASYYGMITGCLIENVVSFKRNGTEITPQTISGGGNIVYNAQIVSGDYLEVVYQTAEIVPFFAMGSGSEATGQNSAAFGDHAKARRRSAFAAGLYVTADGSSAHAEGANTSASGVSSHAEGALTQAKGDRSHAQNRGTIANGADQTALGRHNVPDQVSAVIVGNGGDDNNRSNALTIDWNGNVLCGLVNGIFLGLESITDWNTSYDSTKPLRFLKAWNASNAPESSANIVGIEFNINATNRTQFVFRTNSGAGRNGVFVRHCVGNTWDNWMTVGVS